MIGRAAIDGFSIFKAVVWNTAYFLWHFLAGNNLKPLEPIQWRPAQNLQETKRKKSAMQTQRQLLAISFLCGFVNEDLWTTLQEPKQLFCKELNQWPKRQHVLRWLPSVHWNERHQHCKLWFL